MKIKYSYVSQEVTLPKRAQPNVVSYCVRYGPLGFVVSADVFKCFQQNVMKTYCPCLAWYFNWVWVSTSLEATNIQFNRNFNLEIESPLYIHNRVQCKQVMFCNIISQSNIKRRNSLIKLHFEGSQQRGRERECRETNLTKQYGGCGKRGDEKYDEGWRNNPLSPTTQPSKPVPPSYFKQKI